MDPNGTKPEGKGFPPMMRRMMEQMCGGKAHLDAAALCREMMGGAEKEAGTAGCAMPGCCKPAQASGREATAAPA